MKSMILRTILAAILVIFCPSFPDGLAGAVSNLSIPWSSNSAFERLMADEAERLGTLRERFWQWKKVEKCRGEVAELDRFATANGTSYRQQSCN